MYTEYLTYKKTFMGTNGEYASRLVRIKLKNKANKIEGNMIFRRADNSGWAARNRALAYVTVRCNDTEKTEMRVNLMDVDMIDYL